MSQDPKGFVWYELMARDPAAAVEFYTAVVGWSAAEQTMSNLDFTYTILSTGERPVAGLMAITDEMTGAGAQPGWIGVIQVDDADAAASRIVAAGGAVHTQPMDIPNVGRFAFVSDPGGAVFEIMAPVPMEHDPGPVAPGTPGHVGWHELYAADGGDAALTFYGDQFGWTREGEMEMGPMGQYRFFGTGGEMIGAAMDKAPQMPAGAWQFYFIVDTLDAAIERVTAGGGTVTQGPMEVPGGSWIIQGTDPQGVNFALVAPKR